MRPPRWGLALVLLVGAGAGWAQAQTMKSYSAARQVHGETQLTATVELAAGTLRLAPGGAGTLYHMRLNYDADRFRPQSGYNAAAGEVTLGIESVGGSGLRVSNARQLDQAANVVLSPAVDLTLTARLEAVQAELELGGFRLIAFSVENGASRTVVRFSSLNRVRCSRGEFRAGAAEFRVSGLGNSRCDVVVFEGGVGAATLDFGGAWRNDMKVDARMAAGGLTIRLPRTLGVRMTTDNFLSIMKPEGFVERDGTWLSANYQGAERHLDLSIRSSLGLVKIEWTD